MGGAGQGCLEPGTCQPSSAARHRAGLLHWLAAAGLWLTAAGWLRLAIRSAAGGSRLSPCGHRMLHRCCGGAACCAMPLILLPNLSNQINNGTSCCQGWPNIQKRRKPAPFEARMAMYCHPQTAAWAAVAGLPLLLLKSEAALAIKGALVAAAAAALCRKPQLRLAVNGITLLGAPAGGQAGSG